jgi:hypothetical protein
MRTWLLVAFVIVASAARTLAQEELEPETLEAATAPADGAALPEDQRELALTITPFLGHDWTGHDGHDPSVSGFDAERTPWFTAGVEVRGVFARTWVIGLAGEVSYAQTGGCSFSFAFGRSCSPVREQVRPTADLFGALRIELVRTRIFAMATEVGLGPALGGLGDAFLGGGRAHLRIVFQARQFIGMVGARARLMASTEPGVQFEASLAGVISVGVAF